MVLKKKELITTCGIYLYNLKTRKLLVCHATHSSWKKWSIPKGVNKPYEKVFDAAKRELFEETGLDIDTLSVLKVFPLPAVKYENRNKILKSFLVITDSDIESFKFKCFLLPGKKLYEIDGWKWIELNSLKKYLHESQQYNYQLISDLIDLIDVGKMFR